MTIYVTGNSHTAVLATGQSLLGAAPGKMKIFGLGSGVDEATRFAERDGNRVVMRSLTYAQNLVDKTGMVGIGGQDEHVWVFVMGSHNMHILRDEFWLTAAPSSLNIEGKRPISEGVLRTISQSDKTNIFNFFSDLKAVGARFMVASCPPPRRDHLVDRIGIPAEVVSHINAHVVGSFFQRVEAQNIPVILPPEKCIDDAGFLRHEFAKLKRANGKPDPHHANQAYGKLMVRKILKAVEEAYPETLQAA